METAARSKLTSLPLVLGFIVAFLILHVAYQSSRGTAIERAVIDRATVIPGAWLINHIRPDEAVQPLGNRLVSPYASLSILNGCEGTEALFLLYAAIIGYACSWRLKVFGLVGATALIYVLNQVRMVSLYFVLRETPTLFSPIHGYIGPTLIIAIGCLYYLGWIQWANNRGEIRS